MIKVQSLLGRVENMKQTIIALSELEVKHFNDASKYIEQFAYECDSIAEACDFLFCKKLCVIKSNSKLNFIINFVVDKKTVSI